MLPLAAKYLARGDLDKAAAMASLLNAPSDVGVGAQLSAVLSRIEGHATASAAVHRYLDVVRAVTAPELWE